MHVIVMHFCTKCCVMQKKARNVFQIVTEIFVTSISHDGSLKSHCVHVL
jgi:hypothetical protein